MLKIAKRFIDELGAQPAHGTLAQAILDLGRTFKLDVIAEGIDRVEHIARLRSLGCTLGQGYLLSHPLDVEAATQLLDDPASRVPIDPAATAAAASGHTRRPSPAAALGA